MGSLLLNDAIVTLYGTDIRFDRDVYEQLCARLYDHYDTQSRGSGSYRFSNQHGGSCVIDNRHVKLTEFFAEQPPVAVVKSMAAAAEAVVEVLGNGRVDGYDIQMSARLPQKEVDSDSRVNFLSSDEYIAARFMQDVDYGPLGGTPTGVGLRFLYRRDGHNYDLRVEPYFKDRTFLFLDLGIQYADAGASPPPLAERLASDLYYFEQNVVSFIRWKVAQEPQPRPPAPA